MNALTIAPDDVVAGFLSCENPIKLNKGANSHVQQ